MTSFFELLAAHLATQNVPHYGSAAVEQGDGWVVVDYNCDGRLAYHRTTNAQGQYEQHAALVVFEQGQATPAEQQWLLEARWVALPAE